MNKLVGRILPGVAYENGFKQGNETFPFFSFAKPGPESGWSDQLAISLEQPSKNHFIDRYNRKIAIDGIASALNGSGDSSFLDMGCSSGYLLQETLRTFRRLNAVGVDYFSAGLLHCHRLLPDVPLFQDDLANCHLGDSLFDAITCLNVLEHIQDDVSALKHLFRIAKPGGKLVLTVPMGAGLFDIYDQVHHHVRRYEMAELETKVERAGFQIVRVNYFGVFIYPGFYLVKKWNRLRYRDSTGYNIDAKVSKEIEDTAHSTIMEKLCNIEYHFGKNVRYPFGIRGYIEAVKC